MERVLVVRRREFFDGDWPQGFSLWSDADAQRQVARFERSAFFVDRDRAESNPEWKQLIPYCALTCGDRWFCVERLKAQGEKRLHGLLSIGIGGHINPDDGAADGAVDRALHREVLEELAWPEGAPLDPRPVGMINDDRDAVGSVHCGIAYLIEVRASVQEIVQVREISKMIGGFRTLAGHAKVWQDPRFESWSRLFLQALLGRNGRTEDGAARDRFGG